MKLITLDFETYFDKIYSLRKMTPAEYILDERFETICCAVQVDTGPVDVIDGPDFPAWLAQYPASECISLTFNALFDNCILAWRYGWVPSRMVDGLGISRSLLGHKLRSLSLEKVAEHLELGAKGSTIHSVVGMNRRAIIDAGLMPALHQYTAQDVTLLKGIFNKLAPSFPKSEWRVMDLVLRCCVQPKFVMNVPKLEAHLAAVQAEKARLIAEAGVDKAQLMATAAFAKVLEDLGVVVETKISPTGNEIPALAKTDDFMNALAEHDDSRVQAVAAARLGVKSTLEEKRCERMLAIARLPWHIAGLPAATMPIPLRYAGAHTQRLSGDWKINCLHPDIEILTPAGWQRIKDWQAKTPVMQWWPDGRLTWETAAKKIERDSGELVWFDSPFVKGGFTPDHRMVTMRTGHPKDYTAGWVADHSGLDGIPVSGFFEQKETLSEAQVRLLVALAADGSVCRGIHWQWGFHKERKASRLRQLLRAAGVAFNENKSGPRWSFSTKPTVRACTNTPSQGHGWLQKGFGPWVLALGPWGMDALLDELVYWDGWRHKNGQVIFTTSLREQALWVQTVGHLRGRPATVKRYRKLTNFGECDSWYVFFRRSKLTSIKGNRHPYMGKTYCPSVASSYIIARYDGGIFITGQCQNLPTGRGTASSALRDALEAPPGHKVVVCDLSKIEALLTAWFTRAAIFQDFVDGKDPYCTMASQIFGFPVTIANEIERFVGKSAVLGLGFGLGADNFYIKTAAAARAQGLEVGEVWTPELAKKTVDTYRQVNHATKAFWKLLDGHLAMAWLGTAPPATIGPITIGQGYVQGPDGLRMYYDNEPRSDVPNHMDTWYRYGGRWKKIYGAAFLENIIQFLARIIQMNVALRLAATGVPFLRIAHTIHDELVFVVPDKYVDKAKAIVLDQMTKRPSWGEDIPIKAEVTKTLAQNYGAAK